MRFKTMIRRFVLLLMDRLGDEQLLDLLMDGFRRRAAKLQSADGLRWLFRLEKEVGREQNRLAIAYDNGIHVKHRLTRYHDFFIRRIRSTDHVLDIGCGCGILACDIAQQTDARIVAMDLDQGNIETARKDFPHPGVRYLVGDATQSLPEGSVDVVVLSNVLEHIEDRVGMLLRVRQACNPRCILLRVPLYEREWKVPLRRELGLPWFLDSTHVTEYTAESFAAEMEAAGLCIVHQEFRWGEIWAEVVARVVPEPHDA